MDLSELQDLKDAEADGIIKECGMGRVFAMRFHSGHLRATPPKPMEGLFRKADVNTSPAMNVNKPAERIHEKERQVGNLKRENTK